VARPTRLYSLSLHDALPIFNRPGEVVASRHVRRSKSLAVRVAGCCAGLGVPPPSRHRGEGGERRGRGGGGGKAVLRHGRGGPVRSGRATVQPPRTAPPPYPP